MPTRRDFLNWAIAGFAGGALFNSPLLARVRGRTERAHRVVAGDTLEAIGRRYDVTVNALRIRNRLPDTVIRVGQTLIIPATAERSLESTGSASALIAPVIASTRRLSVKPRRWKYVVAHHSGIEDGNARTYDREHRRRGYENGLAYHFVIGNGRDSGEGEIEIGPRWTHQIQGGHVRSEEYNEHGIGICLVGNFEKRRISAKQLASFTALVDWLRKGAPLGVTPDFTVHRWVDRNHTVCPGKYFPYSAMKERYAIG